MQKVYRVGIIGSTGRGNYGHGVDMAFTKLENVNIVSIADADEAGRLKAQKRTGAGKAYADFREMLATEDLDIVAICPRWIDHHHAMLMAAAEAGCHVYMEKPFCPTLEQCDDVVQALQMRHLHLGIAHVTQYSPVLDTVMSVIRSGDLGEVLEIRGRGKEDRRGGGEDLWVLGSHVFAMMRSFGGGQPLRCSATVSFRGLPVTKKDVVDGAEGLGLLAGDHVQAHYEFPQSVHGFFGSKRGAGGNPTRFGMQVFCSRGILEMQSGYLSPARILQDSSWSPGRTGSQWEIVTSAGIGQPEPLPNATYAGGHMAAIRDLMNSIETGDATRCSAEDCRDIVEMTAAVYESHRLGGPVDLPLELRDNPLAHL